MALPNFRQISSPTPGGATQTMMAGSPVSFNILKERLRSSPGGSPGGSKTDEIKSNPFVQAPFGNNAFNPQRLGTRPMGGSGVAKPPKAPERPLMPYMRFSRKIWESVRSDNKDLKLWEVGKIIGLMWRDLPEAEKREFQDEYELEKAEYDRALTVYKNSPAYQTYMQAKARGVPVVEDPEPKGSKTAERRIDIQPAEDEEDPDDGLSVKHLAHARFMRNHRLINEIFSESMVPDVRSVVSTTRMQVLKRQVQSLTMHQKKLEAELTQIEEKYNHKKRKFLETSEEFAGDLKKHCSKVVDEAKYGEMVAEQVEKLKTEREERARAGAPTPPSPTPPTDPSDHRHVLQPVERGDDPDSPPEEKSKDDKGSKEEVAEGSKVNEEDAKTRERDGIKTEDAPLQYADMANQKQQPARGVLTRAPLCPPQVPRPLGAQQKSAEEPDQPNLPPGTALNVRAPPAPNPFGYQQQPGYGPPPQGYSQAYPSGPGSYRPPPPGYTPGYSPGYPSGPGYSSPSDSAPTPQPQGAEEPISTLPTETAVPLEKTEDAPPTTGTPAEDKPPVAESSVAKPTADS